MNLYTQLDEFFMNMYHDYRTKHIEFQGQGHFFVSGPKFSQLFSPNAKKIVDHNAKMFRLSIS